MNTMFKSLVIGCLVSMLVLSGCVQETDNGGTTGEGMSFTSVLISDAPSDNYSHINVTFSQVKIHKYGDDNDSGWISFDMEPKTIDMIYLHVNNLREELGAQDISVGNYSELWIVVDSATGVLKETGEEITFDVPSGDLKIQQSFEIKGESTTIDVELDLDRSVLYVPEGGVYKLTPQLGKMTINYGEPEDEEEEEKKLEAHAGDEYEAKVNETIEFEGTADGGVEPYNWSWDFGDGNTSTDQNPEYAYSEIGLYDVTLVVTDAENNTSTDTVEVNITDEMSHTTVKISDAPSDNFSHVNVTFSEVKIHKSGDNNDSGWILFDMEPKTIDMIYLHENNLSEELGVKNLTVGNYTKLWIVVDGATGVLKETGENITFDVPSGDLKIQQSFEIKEGNTTIDVELDLDRSILYVPQGGVYKLLPQLGKMTIDHDGKEDEDIEALEADAGDEYEAKVNETIEFEGKADGGVEPYNWSWDFGDGNTSTDQNPKHAYNATGNYTAKLTVTDDVGNTATDTAEVYITDE